MGTKPVPVVPRHALVSYISVPSIMIRLKGYLYALQSIILLWEICFGTPVCILLSPLLKKGRQTKKAFFLLLCPFSFVGKKVPLIIFLQIKMPAEKSFEM